MENFVNIILSFVDKLKHILKILESDIDFSNLKSLLAIDFNKVSQEDIVYQEFKLNEAIQLMDPEDRNNPDAIKLMMEGKYF